MESSCFVELLMASICQTYPYSSPQPFFRFFPSILSNQTLTLDSLHKKVRIFIFSSSIFSSSWTQILRGLLSGILVLNFFPFRRHWKQSPGDFFLALWVLWVICYSSSHSLLFRHLSFFSCFGKIWLDNQIPVDSFALPASRNHKYVSWSPYCICNKIILWKILHFISSV